MAVVEREQRRPSFQIGLLIWLILHRRWLRFVVYFGLNPHNSKLEARKNYLDSRKEPWEEPDSAGGDHLPLARSRCGDPSQLQGGFRLPSST